MAIQPLIDDPVSQSDYVARFAREIAASHWVSANYGDMLDELGESDVVLLGEFHPLPTACAHARRLLRSLAAQRELVVGLEMVHARDQSALDAFAEGEISEKEWLRRVRYTQEWGYPEQPALRLLRACREARIPVRGLDIPPRGSVEDLQLRDAVVARRLTTPAETLRREPLWLILFGEAHLATDHLPYEIARRFPAARIARVFHDINGPEQGLFSNLAHPRTYAFLQPDPTLRSHALESIYTVWDEQPGVDGVDFQSLVHQLIDAQSDVLGLDPRRYELAPGRYLSDAYPAVYGPKETDRLNARLAELGCEAGVIQSVSARCALHGAIYRPQENIVAVDCVDTKPMSQVAAQFLVRVIAREPRDLGKTPPLWRRIAASLFAYALARSIEPLAAHEPAGEAWFLALDEESLEQGSEFAESAINECARALAEALTENSHLDEKYLWASMSETFGSDTCPKWLRNAVVALGQS